MGYSNHHPYKEDKLAGKWEFPGGKLKVGEKPEDCLQRELEEELNILVEATEYFDSNIHEYNDVTIKLVTYCVKWTGGELNLNVHEKAKWVKINELTSYDFAPADIPIVNKLVNRED